MLNTLEHIHMATWGSNHCVLGKQTPLALRLVMLPMNKETNENHKAINVTSLHAFQIAV